MFRIPKIFDTLFSSPSPQNIKSEMDTYLVLTIVKKLNFYLILKYMIIVIIQPVYNVQNLVLSSI